MELEGKLRAADKRCAQMERRLDRGEEFAETLKNEDESVVTFAHNGEQLVVVCHDTEVQTSPVAFLHEESVLRHNVQTQTDLLSLVLPERRQNLTDRPSRRQQDLRPKKPTTTRSNISESESNSNFEDSRLSNQSNVARMERIIEVPVERIVEKLVEKIVEVPKIIEKIVRVEIPIEIPIEIPVEVPKIVEVQRLVEVQKIIHRIIEVPIELVEKHKQTHEVEKVEDSFRKVSPRRLIEIPGEKIMVVLNSENEVQP